MKDITDYLMQWEARGGLFGEVHFGSFDGLREYIPTNPETDEYQVSTEVVLESETYIRMNLNLKWNSLIRTMVSNLQFNLALDRNNDKNSSLIAIGNKATILGGHCIKLWRITKESVLDGETEVTVFTNEVTLTKDGVADVIDLKWSANS